MNDQLHIAFAKWLDSALAAGFPDQVVAFNFDLYEAPASFRVQLIGPSSFDTEDDEWACDEVFSSEERVFELPRATGGDGWEQGIG